MCSVQLAGRQALLQHLKSHLLKYNNKEDWVDKYLEIYNSDIYK